MNGHVESGEINGSSEPVIKKSKPMMKEINILGEMSSGMTSPPPVNKLPKIPKLKSPKKEPTSPLKSPSKGASSHKTKEEPISPRKKNLLSNGLVDVKKEEASDDDVPLRVKEEKPSRKRKAEDDDFKTHKSKKKKKDKKKSKDKKSIKEEKGATKKKVKKEEEEVWRWWEEEPHPEGIKWKTLEHKGPCFPPLYEPLPKNVKFRYNGEVMELSPEAEEVATFYAKMLDHDYTKKEIFNTNFFEDWRKEMTSEERKVIKKLELCDFKEMAEHFKKLSEERKNMTKEEKNVIKEANLQLSEEYGFCMMDGHKQKVGNFRIEPPGLFRGRGDHPKQGKLKKRVSAKEVIINIGKGAEVPKPPPGEKWKAVQHDNTVSWLACWIENIAGNYKYVMLNAATRMKGEKDWQKYETARKLKDNVDSIRTQYKDDWKSKEMRLRQRGVAMYFIDKLALRAGHEKEEGESADTVGCCSLRVEHIKLHPEKDDQEYVVEFDFLGKDSIRYTNNVPVEKRVFKNLQLFMQGKQAGDDLFDRLSTTSLNKFLSEQMPGLTAKVFRTYNASSTLQQQLDELTEPGASVTAKFLQYNRANRAVAILCNHQRAAPKTFDKQMENLVAKLKDKKKAIKNTKKEIKNYKREYHEQGKSERVKNLIEKKKKQLQRLEEQYFKLEVNMTDKEENKEIALGTSKLNYLDPRISVAWCKKHEVPIEKVYNKTQRQKFQWAIDMTEADFVF
ncbi:DNA topoisomerase I, mitochondrial-like isoform X2 [Hydractinia symbiolongicarpus]|uniref:DNA topoisomerase I, mitochondrial-like isoform X2 n=1 Tax=Hydractinia symbiolongicarpus TaxID=13093 RepID=UPI00254BA770|nr:DNA topoisomerase I, mitochondrial-like isoform X2 [Hydractinia symbiolongicarpus]